MKHAPHAPPRADGVGSWLPLRNRQVTFRAYGGPEQVVMVEQADVAPPGPGEARVRVEASSLVFTDTLIRRDLYPMRRTQPGEVLGYDLVGHVESLGPATDGPRPGTRVAALTQVGGGQDWVSLPVSALVPVPGDLDPIRIEPLILSYMTAWQSLTRLAKVNAGDRVLVVAASGAVGFAALDIARALGLRAVGVASSVRRALVEGTGAEFVPYDVPGAGARLDAVAQRDGGFAAILDGAGSEPLGAHLRRLAPQGRYVTFGFTAHLRRAGPDAKGLTLLWGRLRLGLGFATVLLREKLDPRVRSYDIFGLRTSRPDWFRDDLSTLAGLLAKGSITPHVSGVFPPERAAEAHARIEAGGVVGRLVLDLRSEKPVSNTKFDMPHAYHPSGRVVESEVDLVTHHPTRR